MLAKGRLRVDTVKVNLGRLILSVLLLPHTKEGIWFVAKIIAYAIASGVVTAEGLLNRGLLPDCDDPNKYI